MASPASASARPLSLPLTVPLPRYSSRVLTAPSSRLLPSRRVALAPARPGAALLSSLSDAREQVDEEEDEEEEFYEEEDEQQEYDDEEEKQGYDDKDEELVEVGYVSGAHGVRGDVLVTPRTDFPELRFATPGTRWLRARASGKQQVREFELVRGKAHTGKKCWIVSFDGIHNLDQARQIVGSAILVKAGDRPEIEDDEFYSLDLVGMRVIVKDTGKLVGTVGQIFNFGGGDLLQVMIGSAEGTAVDPDSENQDSTSSRKHVWIPFAENIVPDVDMESREMWITPPKGLLELNLRSDKRSKKERRAMEWKDKKRLQRRVIAGKKVLSEMDQGHVLEGLLSGDKVQKASLAEQIGCIDFQLFRHAVHCVSKQIESTSKNLLPNSSLSRKKAIEIPYKSLINIGEKAEHAFSRELKQGLEILLKSKAAILLVRNGSDSDAEFLSLLTSLSELMKVIENCISPPFIIVSPPSRVESVRNRLIENGYFGLDPQKVWVLEELELPIVSISSEANRKKVLMKSPWEIIKRPAGSGGIFSLLSSNKILESLNEMGVQYTQICSSSNRPVIGHPLLFGAVASRSADVGIKLSKTGDMEDDFDLILSIDQLNKMCRDVTQLRFSARPERNAHVEHVNGQWASVQPEAANSHRLHADVTSVLNSCAPDKVCVIEIVEQ
ncbi:putative 16S rRNA-processing protein RimM [Dichanthelium oligosanthes]|uniref:Putative 16S rRNA-processing protein RimM n=1 Tax=Dichanthelium oligosanthes TaxID=888268 RepID=A0A1E5VLF2_9POAL|nr:putative 16S rRNA-processing protein RimM [Dichanthelium oligosanthes]